MSRCASSQAVISADAAAAAAEGSTKSKQAVVTEKAPAALGPYSQAIKATIWCLCQVYWDSFPRLKLTEDGRIFRSLIIACWQASWKSAAKNMLHMGTHFPLERHTLLTTLFYELKR